MKARMILASVLLLVNFAPFEACLLLAQQTARQRVPESIGKIFSGAQTVTLQHRDLSPADITAVEKASGTAWSGDKDFHLYVAIGAKQGKRSQLGAATTLENIAGGLTIAYDNDLRITKVIAAQQRGDATSPGFLGQFIGKDHDDPIKLAQDIKYTGPDQVTAATIADAVRRVTATMQRLYGKAH